MNTSINENKQYNTSSGMMLSITAIEYCMRFINNIVDVEHSNVYSKVSERFSRNSVGIMNIINLTINVIFTL